MATLIVATQDGKTHAISDSLDSRVRAIQDRLALGLEHWVTITQENGTVLRINTSAICWMELDER